jgi:hypothetical protein
MSWNTKVISDWVEDFSTPKTNEIDHTFVCELYFIHKSIRLHHRVRLVKYRYTICCYVFLVIKILTMIMIQ